MHLAKQVRTFWLVVATKGLFEGQVWFRGPETRLVGSGFGVLVWVKPVEGQVRGVAMHRVLTRTELLTCICL